MFSSLANFPNHLRRLLAIANKQFLLIIALFTMSFLITPGSLSVASASTIHDSYALTTSINFYTHNKSLDRLAGYVDHTSRKGHRKSISSRSNKNLVQKHTVKKFLLSHASMGELVARIENKADNHLSPAGLEVLAAINTLRAHFGLQPALPTTVGRGLVIQGARSGNDPNMINVGNAIPEEYSIWGAVSGVEAPSQAATSAVLNAWVYEDGWMGAQTENLDCTSPTAPGCNGHRRAVLSMPPVPGAKLYINVVSIKSNFNGSPSVSIAALLIWIAP